MGVLDWEVWDRLDELDRTKNARIERGQWHRYIGATAMIMVPVVVFVQAITSFIEGERIVGYVALGIVASLVGLRVVVGRMRSRRQDGGVHES